MKEKESSIEVIPLLKQFVDEVKLEKYKETQPMVHVIYINRVVKSLKNDIQKSTLYPSTKKKVIEMVDKYFDLNHEVEG